MSEQPAKRKRLDEKTLGPFDRYWIFTQVYKGAFPLNPDDNLFKKNSEELGVEDTIYGLYLTGARKCGTEAEES